MKYLIIPVLVLLISCSKETVDEVETKEIIRWDVSAGVTHNYNLDQLAGIDSYQNDIYMLGGGGTNWNSVDDPSWNGWEMRKGSNINDLVVSNKPQMTSNFPYYRTDGNNWCYYWLMGLHIDQPTGTFYSIAYSEYNYMNNWVTEAKERRMGLAVSTDKGLTWTYTGDIVTQDKSTPPPVNQQYYGAGDLSFLVPGDGYAYVYYKKGYYSLQTLERTTQEISVARCKLSDQLAPGKWTKFYNGSWTQPGLGGKETVVIPYVNIANVAYNTYLNKYVCIGNAISGKTFIAFATNLEKQDWSERDFSFPNISSHYNWQVNLENSNSYTMGKTFRLYTTGMNVSTGTREGKYYTITFTKTP